MSSNQGNKFRVVGGSEGGGSAPSARTGGAGLKPLSVEQLYQRMRNLRIQMLTRDLEKVQADIDLHWERYTNSCKQESRIKELLEFSDGGQAELLF